MIWWVTSQFITYNDKLSINSACVNYAAGAQSEVEIQSMTQWLAAQHATSCTQTDTLWQRHIYDTTRWANRVNFMTMHTSVIYVFKVTSRTWWDVTMQLSYLTLGRQGKMQNYTVTLWLMRGAHAKCIRTQWTVHIDKLMTCKHSALLGHVCNLFC